MPVRVGRHDYFYRSGFFYRHSPFGYCVVRAPRYAVVSTLPYFATYLTVGGFEYWRYADAYYQRSAEGYVVVDSPYAETVATVAPDDYAGAGYVAILVEGRTYWFKDGQFFVPSPDGLVWIEAPIGAVVPALPAAALSTWFDDIEYFTCEEVVFRKTPDGYRVVTPPWPDAAVDISD